MIGITQSYANCQNQLEFVIETLLDQAARRKVRGPFVLISLNVNPSSFCLYKKRNGETSPGPSRVFQTFDESGMS